MDKKPSVFQRLMRRSVRGSSTERAAAASLASVSARVDDSPGWASLSNRHFAFFANHDYDPARVTELYNDTLTAWRKNPIAWRIIAITTDYVVGDRILISSPNRRLQRFIRLFWDHPKNRIDLRLEAMCDELARAGDLFVLLFRNPQDGMSYLRFVTKDRISAITTAPNDWETEISYTELAADGSSRTWLSPAHPDAAAQDAICLHYAVNRPLGALLGESDLTTMIPWLQRYSRMLEDRVRLHWAVRAFLWMVTVPGSKIMEKQEQYRTPPDTGSIIVKDEGERWEAVTPQLHSADAEHDLRAVRGMIDAGSGYPPHWRGEAADANLATATAMQAPTERHLLRRQRYFLYLLQDVLYQAYQRAAQIGRTQPLPDLSYSELFEPAGPDISRSDNQSLAQAARQVAEGLSALQTTLSGSPPAFQRLALRLFLQFAGENTSPADIDALIADG